MIKCAVRIEFDAGHRVIGHEYKCKYLHGHRYALEVVAVSEKLDQLGMVVDFGVLKSIIKAWIDENFDHNTILSSLDQELGNSIAKHTGQSVYYMPYNPTAENIVRHLKYDVFPILFEQYKHFSIDQIKLNETPNCYAIVS